MREFGQVGAIEERREGWGRSGRNGLDQGVRGEGDGRARMPEA